MVKEPREGEAGELMGRFTCLPPRKTEDGNLETQKKKINMLKHGGFVDEFSLFQTGLFLKRCHCSEETVSFVS